jgi:hypothetical protein
MPLPEFMGLEPGSRFKDLISAFGIGENITDDELREALGDVPEEIFVTVE